MAISRDKKQALVAEIEQLLKNSKAVANATFAGITVKDMMPLQHGKSEGATRHYLI